MAGSITILSLFEARRRAHEFGAIITLEDSRLDCENRLRFDHCRHLVLEFADIDAPRPGCVHATEAHVRSALEFGRTHADASLMIHCMAGIGRSPAMALAIMAERLGPGKEQEAFEWLVSARPEAVPNLMVVGHADALLGRNGALQATVRDWKASLREKGDAAPPVVFKS
jgi:predicted protein tyrosine phosphatase